MKKVLTIYIAMSIYMLMLFSGCTTTRTVEVEKVKTEYINSIDTIRDSIYNAVYVDRYVQGDTVYNTRTHYLYKYKWKTKIDTLCRVDTIKSAEVKEVVRKATLSETWHIFVIGLTIGIVGMLILRYFLIK